MDQLLEALLSFQFALMCLGIGVTVFVIRTVTEYLFKNVFKKENMLWTEVILPLLPIVLGGLTSFFEDVYPDNVTSRLSKVFFGLIAGSASSFVFRTFKSFLKKKLG